MIKNTKYKLVHISRDHNCNQITVYFEILVSVGQSLIDLGHGKRDGESGSSGWDKWHCRNLKN